MYLTKPGKSNGSALSHVVTKLTTPSTKRIALLKGGMFSSSNTRTSTCHDAQRNVKTIFRRPRSRVIAAIARSSITFNPRGLTVTRSSVSVHVTVSLSTISVDKRQRTSPAQVDKNRRRHITVTNVLTVGPRVLILSRPATVLSPRNHTSVVRVLSRLRRRNAAVVLIARRHSRFIGTSHVVHLSGKHVIRDTHNGATDVPRVSRSNATRRSGPVTGSGVTGNTSGPASTMPVVRVRGLVCRCPGDDGPILSGLSVAVGRNRAITVAKRGNTNGAALTHLLYTLRRPRSNDVAIGAVPITHRHTGNGVRPLGHTSHRGLHTAVNCIVRRPRHRLFTRAMTRSITCNPHGRQLSRTRISRRIDRTVTLLRVRRLTSHSPFSLSNKRRQLITVTNIVTYRPQVLVVSRPATKLSRTTAAHIRSLVRALRSRNIAMLVVSRSRARVSILTSQIVTLSHERGNGSIAQSVKAGIASRATNSGGLRALNSKRTGRSIHRGHDFVRQLSPHIGVIDTLTIVFSTFTVHSF